MGKGEIMVSKGNKRILPYHWYKKGSIYIISIIALFIVVGLLTTIKPAYRLSSQAISKWTSDIDSSTFLYVMGLENRVFKKALPSDESFPNLSGTLFNMFVQLKPNDPRSFLRTEIPGFYAFDSDILIAGEGTNYTNLPHESSPPLEDVLKEHEAVLHEDEENDEEPGNEPEEKETEQPSTGGKNVVFIYNTHNNESFLPHLPDVSSPNRAFHKKVNVTKISNYLADALENRGIGTKVDDTDIAERLNDRGMKHSESYSVSRDVVKEAFEQDENIVYSFDIHRDAMGRDVTTKEINGEDYARIMIVVGEEYASYEKNLALATEIHYLLDEMYPGLSRGVLAKKGAGTNGVFNQDLSDNAILIEFGGVENTLEELYRSADALADVFGEYYWDAEKVDTTP